MGHPSDEQDLRGECVPDCPTCGDRPDLPLIRDRWLREGESDGALVRRLVDGIHDAGCHGCVACRMTREARADVGALVGEVERLRGETRNARCIARVLAHSYEHDSTPPRAMVAEALAWPVDGGEP